MSWRTDQPPLNVSVLVSDGDEISIDYQWLRYAIDGRVLLPGDPRRADIVPERVWARYVNVTHWMPLPDKPTIKQST